jgi:hypothetical protein
MFSESVEYYSILCRYKWIIHFTNINTYFVPSPMYRPKHLKENRHHVLSRTCLHLYFKIKNIRFLFCCCLEQLDDSYSASIYTLLFTHQQVLLGRSNQGEWGGQGMWHARERGETCTWFWWESPKEKDHLKDQGVDGRMGSKWTLRRLVGGVLCAFAWLRIGIVGRLLWMRWWTFGFWRHGLR